MCTSMYRIDLHSSHLHGVRVTPEQGRKPCGGIRKRSIFENTVEWEQNCICWDLNGQSMNNPEQCFPAQIGRHCVCVRGRESERWGHRGVGIHPSPKYYAVVKNICNARRYFEKYLKKFNTVLTFCWAFVSRFALALIWLRVRENVLLYHVLDSKLC